MTMFFGNASALFGLAIDARDRARELCRGYPKATPPDAIVAVVMAVVGAEAFINELPVIASVLREQSGGAETVASTQLDSVGRLLSEIEAEKGSLKLKYQIAALALAGKTLDPGCNPFQDF